MMVTAHVYTHLYFLFTEKIGQIYSQSMYFFDFVNLFVGEKKSKFDVKFDDRSVCKSFLLGCCPHDILSATVSITAHG